jgi:hypothetical protein
MTAEPLPNFCPFCGSLTRSVGSFCHACGEPLVETGIKPQPVQEGRPSFCCLCGNKWPDRGNSCSSCGADADGNPIPRATDPVPGADPETVSPALTSGVTSGVPVKSDGSGTNNLKVYRYGEDRASPSVTMTTSDDEGGGAESSLSATSDTPPDETTVDETVEKVTETGPSKTDFPSTRDVGSGANSDSSETPAENTSTPLSMSSGTNRQEAYGSQSQDVQGTSGPTHQISSSISSGGGNHENRDRPGPWSSIKRILGFDQRLGAGIQSLLVVLVLLIVVILVLVLVFFSKPKLPDPAVSATQQPTPAPITTAVSTTATASATAQPSPTATPEPSPSPSPTSAAGPGNATQDQRDQ